MIGDPNPFPSFCAFKVGFPSTKLQLDTDWDEYRQGGENHQGFNPSGFRFDESSGYFPSEQSERALAKQLVTYGMEMPADSVEYDEIVESWLFELEAEFITPCRFLTFWEAIYGISDEEGTLEPLDPRKSPGFGFSLKHNTKGGWLECDLVFLKETVDRYFQLIKDGHTLLFFMKASEKDEKRDWERVMEFKTRLFMAAPIVDTILGRMLRGDFVRKYTRASKNMNFYCAAGLETMQGGWDKLIRWLTFDLMVTRPWGGDVAKFDKLFPHQYHMLNGELTARHSSDQAMVPIVMRQYASDAYSPAVCTITGDVFLRPCDEPSGKDNTLVENSRAGMRVLLTAWRKCAGKNSTLSEFRRYVRAKFLGDDLVFCRFPGCPLTIEAVVSEYARHGWLITLPDDCHEYLDDSYFAGRRSVLAIAGDWEVFLPVIDRNRILAINEIRKGRKDPVKRLMRAYAAADHSFPLLFETDEGYLFTVLYDYYLLLKKRALMSGDKLLVATAQGLPQYDQIWSNYTGLPSPTSVLDGLISMHRRVAQERSKNG